MRIVLPLLLAAGVASTAQAATPAATTGPAPLGTFEAWTAATYASHGQKICYTFTRPTHSSARIAGRGQVLLSVTERHGSRDEAAVSAGFEYPKGASVTVDVGNTKLPFYTSGKAAFARNGSAAVRAFKIGLEAEAHSPAPGGKEVTDTFSLHGFSAAYEATLRACPEK